MVPHRHMQICLRNAQQMIPSVNTIVSDFADIPYGDDLQLDMLYVN